MRVRDMKIVLDMLPLDTPLVVRVDGSAYPPYPVDHIKIAFSGRIGELMLILDIKIPHTEQ